MRLFDRQRQSTNAPTLPGTEQAVPSGTLRMLRPDELVPSGNNPRHLFDPEPLLALKDNIREHGVLVPITVYLQKGETRYSILDGQRRHRCCQELRSEGHDIEIPANVVVPPSKIASLVYMFSIHNIREAWELMPTALGLATVMEELDETDSRRLATLTGLSEPQIERCKKLLAFPERFQNMSLDPDPTTRIPGNLWIEAYPVLELVAEQLPDMVKTFTRDGITDLLVSKYKNKGIKSVIHLRRIIEAYDLAETSRAKLDVVDRLRDFLLDERMETRTAFDGFVMDNRRIQGAINACEDFVRDLQRMKLDNTLDRDELRNALLSVRSYADELIQKLEGTDPPAVDETVGNEDQCSLPLDPSS